MTEDERIARLVAKAPRLGPDRARRLVVLLALAPTDRLRQSKPDRAA